MAHEVGRAVGPERLQHLGVAPSLEVPVEDLGDLDPNQGAGPVLLVVGRGVPTRDLDRSRGVRA